LSFAQGVTTIEVVSSSSGRMHLFISIAAVAPFMGQPADCDVRLRDGFTAVPTLIGQPLRDAG